MSEKAMILPKPYEIRLPYKNAAEAGLPAWHSDPATIPQLKLLNFFGKDISKPLTKGACSGMIARLFYNPDNKHLWDAYAFVTGDEDTVSTELQTHDKSELAKIVIPEDWKPKRNPRISGSAKDAMEQTVKAILEDGSPFDDPLPEFEVSGKLFCFTGNFLFGERSQCENAILALGGLFTDDLRREVDVLVIGNKPSPLWSNRKFGNKIYKAMRFKLCYSKPMIIPETYWKDVIEAHVK